MPRKRDARTANNARFRHGEPNTLTCSVAGCERMAGYDGGIHDGKPYCKNHKTRQIRRADLEEALAIGAAKGKPHKPLITRADLPNTSAAPGSALWNQVYQKWTREQADYWRGVMNGEIAAPTGWPREELLGRCVIAFAESCSWQPNTLPQEQQRYAFPRPYREFFIAAASQDREQARFSVSLWTSAKKNGKSTALAYFARSAFELPICTNPTFLVAAPSVSRGALADFIFSVFRSWPGGTHSPGVGAREAPFLLNNATNTVVRNPAFFGGGDSGVILNFSETTNTQTQVAPRGLIIVDELGRQRSLHLLRTLEDSRRAHLPTFILSVSILGEPESPHVRYLDEAERAKRPDVHIKKFQGNPDDPYSDASICAANPLLGMRGGPQLAALRKDAAAAQRVAEKQPPFFRETLNIPYDGIGQTNICTPAEWRACSGTAKLIGPLTLGVDLGLSRDNAALSFYDRQTHALVTECFIPYQEKDLETLTEMDGINYLAWHKTGRLHTADTHKLVSLQKMANVLMRYHERYGISDFFADPQKFRIWRSMMVDIQPPVLDILPDVHFVNHTGPGFMSLFIDHFQIEIKSGRVRHGDCPMLKNAFVRSRLRKMPAGYNVIDKTLPTGESRNAGYRSANDAMVSGVLAVAGISVLEAVGLKVPNKNDAKMAGLTAYLRSLPDAPDEPDISVTVPSEEPTLASTDELRAILRG